MTKRILSILYTVLAHTTILLLWILYGGGIIGVALMVALCAASVLRYRYVDYIWISPICGVLVLIATYFSPIMAFACILPITASMERKLYIVCPFLLAGLIPLANPNHIPILLICAGLSIIVGQMLLKWQESEDAQCKYSDRERAIILELEQTKVALMTSSARARNLAQEAERTRIARDLHDHTGHELIGVLLALQTVEKLIAANDDRADDVLRQAIERLKTASEGLRETVHNLKPDRNVGLDAIKRICANFNFCPCDFISYGDFSSVISEYWELLEAILKEMLTNVAKHSNGTRVSARLDISRTLLRLATRDNGTPTPGTINMHLGLKGMRERCAMFGGSLSIDNSNGFTVICILPINEEEKYDNSNS